MIADTVRELGRIRKNRRESRGTAAFPDRFTRTSKFWPSVGRVDNVHGDRNLVCSCVGVAAYVNNDAAPAK